MASAFDEAEQRRISSSGTKPPTFNPISSTTGKTIPGGSTAVLVERLNRSLAEFRKEVMKSAGHESKKNATILRKQEMMQMLIEAKECLDRETRESSDANQKTMQRIKADYSSVFIKFDTFCKETVNKPSFFGSSASGVSLVEDEDGKYAVKNEGGKNITIQAGRKTMVFKTLGDGDVNGALIEERDVEARNIAKKTADLNALFVDVAQLVEEQQEGIDEVVNNTETADSMTKEGLGQLEQAHRTQRTTGKVFCYFSIALILIAGGVVGAIVLMKKV